MAKSVCLRASEWEGVSNSALSALFLVLHKFDMSNSVCWIGTQQIFEISNYIKSSST